MITNMLINTYNIHVYINNVPQLSQMSASPIKITFFYFILIVGFSFKTTAKATPRPSCSGPFQTEGSQFVDSNAKGGGCKHISELVFSIFKD